MTVVELKGTSGEASFDSSINLFPGFTSEKPKSKPDCYASLGWAGKPKSKAEFVGSLLIPKSKPVLVTGSGLGVKNGSGILLKVGSTKLLLVKLVLKAV